MIIFQSHKPFYECMMLVMRQELELFGAPGVSYRGFKAMNGTGRWYALDIGRGEIAALQNRYYRWRQYHIRTIDLGVIIHIFKLRTLSNIHYLLLFLL